MAMGPAQGHSLAPTFSSNEVVLSLRYFLPESQGELKPVDEIQRNIRAMNSGSITQIRQMLMKPGHRLESELDAQCLFCIVEFLAFTEARQESFDVACMIFGYISNLGNKLHSSFVAWYQSLSTEDFGKRVDLVNQTLSRVLFSNSDTYYSDWRVRACAMTMSILYASNAARKNGVPLSAFYNLGVDQTVDLVRDFLNWQKGTPFFRFCQYPFLLSLGSKMEILRVDSKIQQSEKLKEALVHMVIRSTPTDPFLTRTYQQFFMRLSSQDPKKQPYTR